MRSAWCPSQLLACHVCRLSRETFVTTDKPNRWAVEQPWTSPQQHKTTQKRTTVNRHTHTSRGIWRGLGPGVCWGTCKAGPNSGHNARAQPKKAGFTYCPQRVPQSGSVRKGGKVREKVGTAHPRLSSQEPFLAALCTPSHSGRGRAKSWMYRTPTNKNHEDPQTPRLQHNTRPQTGDESVDPPSPPHDLNLTKNPPRAGTPVIFRYRRLTFERLWAEYVLKYVLDPPPWGPNTMPLPHHGHCSPA